MKTEILRETDLTVTFRVTCLDGRFSVRLRKKQYLKIIRFLKTPNSYIRYICHCGEMLRNVDMHMIPDHAVYTGLDFLNKLNVTWE